MKGKFFVFEGVDGSGKSTTIEKVAENLTNKGYDVFVTGEPTHREIGKCFRDLALHKGIDPLTELHLICADRNEHILKDINPAIEQGKIVLCDRFYMSTLAYQVVDLSYSEYNDCLMPDLYHRYSDIVFQSIRGFKHEISFIWFDIHFNTYKKRIKNREDNDIKDSMSEKEFNRRRNKYYSLFNPPYRQDPKLYINSNKIALNVKKITSFIEKEVAYEVREQITALKKKQEYTFLEV